MNRTLNQNLNFRVKYFLEHNDTPFLSSVMYTRFSRFNIFNTKNRMMK